MSTVWKFPLEVADSQIIETPAECELLTVQIQNSQLCLWARVNPSGDSTRWLIRVRGTGHPVALGRYLGTVQQMEGALVWHVFAEEIGHEVSP